MKKVGILAYHSACNYGANLQILSTLGYLRKCGYVPFVINYEAKDFNEYYKRVTPKYIYEAYSEFRKQYMPLTCYCSSEKEIADVINELGIDAVIIGSDAVAQHHSLLERLYFPTKKIFTIVETTSDRVFPNPFWGTFYSFLDKKISMFIMSASSQDSNYRLFLPSEKKNMRGCLDLFSYVSVRDTWTKEMYEVITNGKLSPRVTPDPVFAFNFNCDDLIPSKKYILDNLGTICEDIRINENISYFNFNDENKEFDMVFYWDNLLNSTEKFICNVIKEDGKQDDFELDDIKDIANSLLSDEQTKNLAIEKIRNVKSKDYEI